MSMLPQPSSDDEATIHAPARFFNELGQLHDADVSAIRWSPVERDFAISLEDLYANFLDLPEHPGLQPARVILSGVSRLQIDVASESPPLRIRSFEVSESATQIHVVVMFEHDGSVQMDCNAVVCRPLART
jgi:hypothetical protein